MTSNTQATIKPIETYVGHYKLVELMNRQSADNIVNIIRDRPLLIYYLNEGLLTKEIALAALTHGNGVCSSCLVFNDDEKIILKMCENSAKDNTRSLNLASDRLQNDVEFVIKCICANPNEFGNCKFQGNRTLALLFVSSNSFIFKHLSEIFRSDKEIVEKALKHSNTFEGRDSVVEFMGESLKRDSSFITSLFERKYLTSSCTKIRMTYTYEFL